MKNIKFVNNNVEVSLDLKSFFISKENYIENPLVIGEDISDDKIDYLLDYENVITNKLYFIKLLSRKFLSEYEIYLKLKEKELDLKHIKTIINDLKRIGLINDEFVCLKTIDSEMVKRKGKKEIVRVLKEKRIDEKIIEKNINEISEEDYLSNFDRVVKKYEKMYNKKGSVVKEKMLKQKLEELGYEKYLINGIVVRSDENHELELAKSALTKLIKTIDISKKENINKIKIKLAMKGFNYDIINLALEEAKQDETY